MNNHAKKQNQNEARRIKSKNFWENIRKLFISIGLIIFVLFISIFGFVFIEGYSISEGFYMTVITLSTVGYGEVRPLTEQGRIFASILIITNLGIFTYAVSILSTFIIEGNFRNMLQDFSIQKKINQLSNHVVICGFGRYGLEISSHFQKHKIPFVVIESDSDTIQRLRNNGEILFLQGDAVEEEVLQNAGIERARSLVSSLPDDAENAYVILTAKQVNPNLRIISRAERQKSERTLKMAGADEVITPENIGGFYMAALVGQPYLVEFFRVMTGQTGGQISLQELNLDMLPKEYEHKTIRELNIRANTGANVIGVKKENGEYIVNPSADLIIQPKMRLIVMGNEEQIIRFKKFWSKYSIS